MKKSMFMALALVVSASFCTIDAAKKKKVVEPEVPVVLPVQLNNSSDSVSYAGGVSMTLGLDLYLQQQGLDSAYMADFVKGFKEYVATGEDPKFSAYVMGLEIGKQVKERMLPTMAKNFEDTPDSIITDIYMRGFTDALEGDTTVFTVESANSYFAERQRIDQEAKTQKLYGQNREAGEKFLAENAQKEGVITLPSGLQYKVLVKGDGQVPNQDDKVLVNYEGRLLDGTVFDASAKHGSKPAEFRPDQVIKGWTEALTMMPVGSKWQLYIPAELGYGERAAGKIQPYSTLIFDVELVGIAEK
ncbi:MAG: FKBP-type peptidyl-prolyl cis-trans isomerase [Prevotella sp.]|nr:FKBP-type peptidyl-prolyl cis-trans isomerase [Prevotella sp.]